MKDPVTGFSRELDQAIEIALYGSTILENKKQVDALLNVILSAAGPASDFHVSLQKALPSF